jgi:hypothetical protein
MPKVKRTTTEVQEIEQPQVEAKPTLADFDMFDHFDKLKDSDFVDGSLVKRKYYLYQDQPPPGKVDGEPGYAAVWCKRFSADDLRVLNPNVTRWKIIEKVMGDIGSRKTWLVSMMPLPPNATVAPGTVPATSEMGQAFKTVAELAQDRTGVQREAMTASMGILGEAYKRGIDMMPKPGSFAEELKTLKETGLLNIEKPNGGFGLTEVKGLLEWGLPRLKELGLLGAVTPPDSKKELDRVLGLIDVIENRFGKSKRDDSVWPLVIQTFGPSLAGSLERISFNVARMIEAKAGLPVSAPAPAAGNGEANVARVSSPATPGEQLAPAAQPGQPVMSPQDYVKLRLVALCYEELMEDSPDASNIANWLHMTAPQLTRQLVGLPEAGVMGFLNSDPVLKTVTSRDNAIALFQADMGSDPAFQKIAQLTPEQFAEKAEGLKRGIYSALIKDAAAA